MSKIEISTSDAHEFSEDAYKKAVEAGKNIIDNLTAENQKLKKMMDSLSQTNQNLRIANAELQKYIDTHKTAEPQKEAQKGAERPFEDCAEECNLDCENCEVAEGHCMGDDDTVDEAIDQLIRENLDLEGQMKGYQDALHILCAWLKYNPDEAKGEQQQNEH